VSHPISHEAPPAIEATAVAKSYGPVTALDGVDLVVHPGTITALLGPNGAGKTTLVRIIGTLASPDAGRLRVLGFDVAAEPQEVRTRIGLTGQYAGLDEALTGRDNLVLMGRLAGLRRREARERAGELAELFDLTSVLGRAVRTYSGGMRRRVDIAASLMSRPALLVLDEPTTGLDPAGRGRLWAALDRLRAAGTTMLLTTQYLEEADRFADIVHVLHHGRIIASGTVAQLKERVGGQVVEARMKEPATARAACRALTRRLHLPAGGLRTDTGSGRLTLLTRDGIDTLLTVAAALRADGIQITDLGIRRPSLDEAFLALTRPAEDAP
jgi:ABC-2 type transport system ATP-binding protein